ncbi:MAG: c-type cytochrome [Gammaproteobacteria bacterium]
MGIAPTRRRWRLTALLTGLLAATLARGADVPDPSLAPDSHGRSADVTAIDSRLNRVFPDGRGLPAGRGTVTAGARLYARHCVACHGVNGRGGSSGELAGGNPDLTAPQPDKTIGTYWPYATTLFDFIRRAMPLNAPWSLADDDVYSLVAYLLHLNGLVASDFVADARSLATFVMPNRDGFDPIDAELPTLPATD